jgi:hypothetical protein
MELHRGQRDIMTIQERDRVEFREMLLTLITTENILKSPGAAVEGIMQSLQTELHDPSLESTQVQKRFQQALWNLHKGTSMLPPMMDCKLFGSLLHYP